MLEMLERSAELTHEQVVAWWDKKTDAEKFRAVGVEIIDKWVKDIIDAEFKASDSVIKPL